MICTAEGNKHNNRKSNKSCGEEVIVAKDDIFITEDYSDNEVRGDPVKRFLSFQCKCGAITDIRLATSRDKYPTYTDWIIQKNGVTLTATHALKLNIMSDRDRKKRKNKLKKYELCGAAE